MTRPGIEPQPSGPLVNTLLIRPIKCSSVALQIRHTQTPITRTLNADLSTDHRSSLPQSNCEGNVPGHAKRARTCLACRAEVFVDHPTLRASVAQGLFLGGTRRRAVAHMRPEFPKMPMAPSAFPLLGAPQAPGDEPNPPRKGVKAWGEGPLRPKENIPLTEPHPAGSVPPPARPTEMMDWKAEVFIDRPTLRASVAQDPFLGGTGHRAVAHRRPEFPKMPTVPSAFPLLGAPQAPGD